MAVAHSRAEAQTPAPETIVLRVEVRDANARGIADADVSVVKGVQAIVAQGKTTAQGFWVMSVPRIGADYQVIVRKIGYQRNARFVAPARAGDTVVVPIVMRPPVQTLTPVTVTADQDLKRKSYHIDADEIMNSPRTIIDGTDVITKLKPDMMNGRDDSCPLSDIWINGKLQMFPAINDVAEARRTTVPKAKALPRPGAVGRNTRPPIDTVRWVLARIKPEHIDEITFQDCGTNPVQGWHTRGAVFVVLKPGVSFDAVKGTFLTDSLHGVHEHARIAHGPTAMPTQSAERLLGVFDDDGPVADAVVTDSVSGLNARTTRTGTVSLAFLDTGRATLFVAKAAHARARLDVGIAADDTTPITLLLTKDSVSVPVAQDTSRYRDRLMGLYAAIDGSPVKGAEVVDLGSGKSMVSNSAGLVTLGFVPDGGSLVRIRKLGFTPITRFIYISPSDTEPITALLSPMIPLLPATVTQEKYLSPALRGFVARARSGIGHFSADEQLRKRDGQTLCDALPSLVGLIVRRGRNVCYAASTRMNALYPLGNGNTEPQPNPYCKLAVYEDGVPQFDPDLAGLWVSDYAGIEYYAGPEETPAEFNRTDAACGVLLLWTRER